MAQFHVRYSGLDGTDTQPTLQGAPKPLGIDPAQRGWDDAIAGKSALQAPRSIRRDPSAYTVYLWAHFEAYGAIGRPTPFAPIEPNPMGVRAKGA